MCTGDSPVERRDVGLRKGRKAGLRSSRRRSAEPDAFPGGQDRLRELADRVSLGLHQVQRDSLGRARAMPAVDSKR